MRNVNLSPNTCVPAPLNKDGKFPFLEIEFSTCIYSGLFKITENIPTVIYRVNEGEEIVGEILDTGTYSTILKCSQFSVKIFTISGAQWSTEKTKDLRRLLDRTLDRIFGIWLFV